MADQTVPVRRDAQQIVCLLASSEVAELIVKLDKTRWTGRPGYPIRAMVGMALVKALYVLPTWTRTARLVAEHKALQDALGCIPSVYACYRFTEKLRQFNELVTDCIEHVIVALHDELPEMGTTVAIDGSDLPAYANGQRFVSRGGAERKRFSDPDASWGHRSAISTRKGGGFYGYKVHAAVCTTTGLPLAWEVHTAKDAEVPVVPSLLNSLERRGFEPTHAVLNRGYDDAQTIYDECADRDILPIIPLRETLFVKQGKAAPPSCEHGTWTFAGSDAKRGASKWRCPTGECKPASVWVKADRLHPLVPRETAKFKAIYHQRGAVEREFGYLKHEWALLPLRVRRIQRVTLHVNLTILGRLAFALDNAHEAPSEAVA